MKKARRLADLQQGPEQTAEAASLGVLRQAFGGAPYQNAWRVLDKVGVHSNRQKRRLFYEPAVADGANPALTYQAVEHRVRLDDRSLFVDRSRRRYASAAGRPESDRHSRYAAQQRELFASSVTASEIRDAMEQFAEQMRTRASGSVHLVLDCILPRGEDDVALPVPQQAIWLYHSLTASAVRVRVLSVLGNQQRRRRSALVLAEILTALRLDIAFDTFTTAPKFEDRFHD
jgi:hypothetical protein